MITQKEKINYMKIACDIAGFNVKYEDMDLFVSLYDLVVRKKGKTNLKDVCTVKAEVMERLEQEHKHMREMLAKIGAIPDDTYVLENPNHIE